jgi:two-component sensor histidine kinase
MKACIFFLISCMFFLIPNGYGQSAYKTPEAAQEQVKVVTSLADTKEKADALLKLSQWYYDHIPADTTFTERAFLLATHSRRLATTLKHNKGLLNAYLLLSKINNVKGDFKQGASNAENALGYAVALKDETGKGDAYMAISESKLTGMVDFGEQLKILGKAEIAFHNSGNKKREADCNFRLADTYLYLNDHLNTGIKLRLSLKLYKEAGYTHIANVYDLLGVFYRNLGNFVPAVNNGLLAIKTAEEEENPVPELGLYYCNLGMTYNVTHDFPLTMKYLRKALAYETAHANRNGIFQISIYLNRVLFAEGKFRDALKVLTDMTKNYPSIEHVYLTQYAACMLNTYRCLGDNNSAMTFCKMLEDAKEQQSDNLEVLILSYPKLIPFYAVLGKTQKVKQSLQEYYRHVKAMNTPLVWAEYYQVSFFADSVAGNYLGALNNYRQVKLLKDSVMEQTKMQQISELNVMYETAQKDKNLLMLKKESGLKSVIIKQSDRVRNISIILAAALMAIAVIIYVGYRRKQKTNVLLKRHQEEIARKNEALETLVKEKEWLVKEIHHRVKNNLHMVVGLLASQTEFLKNKEALNAINDSQNRIQAMSLIHQKLYQVGDMSSINMPVYIQELTEHLKDSFKDSTHVLFKLDIVNVDFPLSYSVPIGLILNEAITNAMKYAFPDKKGSIEIKLAVRGDFYHLSIKDNGIGLSKKFNPEECTSLGIILMNGLSGDIGGTFNMENMDKGLLIETVFPVENITP